MLRRLLIGAVLTCAGALGLAGPAFATGTVSIANTIVTVDLSPNAGADTALVMRDENNDLVIQADATPVAPCAPAHGSFITCPDPEKVTVRLGAGDDAATGRAPDELSQFDDTLIDLRLEGDVGNDLLVGSFGADELIGGSGFDTFYAGGGNDEIEARDGNPERIDCGEGADDEDSRDDFDEVAGCEQDDHNATQQGDLDKDNVQAPVDCNDVNPAINPSATDVPDNGVDENCDGVDATNRDRDGDGIAAPADCNDANAAIKPGVREVYGNTVDEDCSGRAEPLQTIEAGAQTSFVAGKGVTTVERLRVAGALPGTVVLVSCIKGGKSCPLKAARVLAVGSSGLLDLRKQLKLRKVKRGVVLEVRLRREDSIDRIFRYTFKRKGLPSSDTLCQRPGAPAPGECE